VQSHQACQGHTDFGHWALNAMNKIDDMALVKRMDRDFGDVFAPDRERSWEVWTEGYRDTGKQESAVYHGRYCGVTFEDALVRFKDSLDSKKTRRLVNIRKGTFWGCRFFNNEIDAREAFG